MRDITAATNYAVRHPTGGPDKASQHPECNGPAPPYPSRLDDHGVGPARYVTDYAASRLQITVIGMIRLVGGTNIWR